ncbi:MAG: hypothetical protein ACOYJW_04480 [Candidatus Omnitrophota bacterium]|jgi:hypothetical protein
MANYHQYESGAENSYRPCLGDSSDSRKIGVETYTINVEGHGLFCVRGVLATLRRDRSAFLVEVSKDPDDSTSSAKETVSTFK